MKNITDMIVSALLKKGILYEARNVDVEIDIPKDTSGDEIVVKEPIKVHFKCDNMSIKIEKGEAEA